MATTDKTKLPCSFYFSDKGCTRGAKCPFAHTGPPPAQPALPPTPKAIITPTNVHTPSKVVPSTVATPIVTSKHSTVEAAAVTPSSHGKKSKSDQVAMEESEVEPPKEKKKKRKHSEEVPEEDEASMEVVEAPVASPPAKKAKLSTPVVTKPTTVAQTPTESTSKKSKAPKSTENVPKKAATPNPTPAIPNTPVTPSPKKAKKPKAVSSAKPAVDVSQGIPAEVATKYQLVPFNETRQSYSFTSSAPAGDDLDFFKELERETMESQSYTHWYSPLDKNGWCTPRAHGEWCAHLPHVYALDCEMSITEDPLEESRDSKALVRVSMINARTGEVLFDSLVKPYWPIIATKEDIHGITEERLQGVTCTLRHIQALFMTLVCSETILIGHALHNDLMSLHMDCAHVIDTACMYKIEGSTKTVALSEIAEHVLGRVMPDIHDSVYDAQVALDGAWYYGSHRPVPPIRRVGFLASALSQMDPALMDDSTGCHHTASCIQSLICRHHPVACSHQLMLHRLPPHYSITHIQNFFTKVAKVVPTSVGTIESTSTATSPAASKRANGRSVVSFSSPDHSRVAFTSLKGKIETDKLGFPQKKVFLPSGNSNANSPAPANGTTTPTDRSAFQDYFYVKLLKPSLKKKTPDAQTPTTTPSKKNDGADESSAEEETNSDMDV